MLPKLVKLVASKDDTKISVHRETLAGSSSVFAEILAKDTTVYVDADGKTLLELLRFIHHGQVPNLPLFARNLSSLAHFYKLTSLKTICETSLAATMTWMNVIDYLLVAHTYEMNILKRRCKLFIRESEVVFVNPTLYLPLYKMVEKNDKKLNRLYIFAKIREKCNGLFGTELTPMNVIDMMLFADYYKMNKLAVKCRQMIEKSWMMFLEPPFFLAVWKLADDRSTE